MKVTIITVVKNRERYIGDAIDSITNQSYKNIEHIIIDGNSSDDTWSVINRKKEKTAVLIREDDDGIYDALNKGVAMSSGDIIGVLHSDDIFAYNSVISDVVEEFSNNNIKWVYGDLDYISSDESQRIIRKWIAGDFLQSKIKMGWMPPHPTVFVKSELIKNGQPYNTKYKISSDYDFLLNLILPNHLSYSYIPKILVKMRIGGISNSGFINILKKIYEDYQIVRSHSVGGLHTIFLKSIRKLGQFL